MVINIYKDLIEIEVNCEFRDGLYMHIKCLDSLLFFSGKSTVKPTIKTTVKTTVKPTVKPTPAPQPVPDTNMGNN